MSNLTKNLSVAASPKSGFKVLCLATAASAAAFFIAGAGVAVIEDARESYVHKKNMAGSSAALLNHSCLATTAAPAKLLFCTLASGANIATSVYGAVVGTPNAPEVVRRFSEFGPR